jgi:hypothetical protein
MLGNSSISSSLKLEHLRKIAIGKEYQKRVVGGKTQKKVKI